MADFNAPNTMSNAAYVGHRCSKLYLSGAVSNIIGFILPTWSKSCYAVTLREPESITFMMLLMAIVTLGCFFYARKFLEERRLDAIFNRKYCQKTKVDQVKPFQQRY